MNDVRKQRKINDRVAEISSKRSVAVYVDLDSVASWSGAETLDHRQTAYSLMAIAGSIGRTIDSRVYYSPRHEDYEMDTRPWRDCGFTPVRINDVEDDGPASIAMALDANATEAQVCVMVAGDANYNLAARYLIKRGVVCVIVGEYQSAMRVLPRDSCVYVPIRSALDGMYKEDEDDFDPASYDYTPFIELLNDSESRMPFVGTKHFINKVMWRLDRMNPNGTLNRQAIFQSAVDADIVELYETENINGSENMVSSCRLNHEHPKVREALSVDDVPDTTVITSIVVPPDGNTMKDGPLLSDHSI